jgi:Tfp pilus assembly protein PilO
MNVNSLFFQIVMAGLAIGIVILYIQPAFVRIGTTQDAIDQYQTEIEKVSEVNNKLTELINQVNTISAADQRDLLIYMPNEVDNISVSRDIYNLASASNVTLVDVNGTEERQKTTDNALESEKAVAEALPVPHSFSVSISGSYENIKSFLSKLEQSNYPLEVHDLEIAASALEELTAKMEIVTYSHL